MFFTWHTVSLIYPNKAAATITCVSNHRRLNSQTTTKHMTTGQFIFTTKSHIYNSTYSAKYDSGKNKHVRITYVALLPNEVSLIANKETLKPINGNFKERQIKFMIANLTTSYRPEGGNYMRLSNFYPRSYRRQSSPQPRLTVLSPSEHDVTSFPYLPTS